MALNLTPEDLLKYQLALAPITFSDGLTATLIPEAREFVTSPNQMQIPRPPMGSTRNLYRRADGFYGEDDPVQCPQPFNHKYCYLACIPTAPQYETDPYYSDWCMWDNKYGPSHFDQTRGESRALKEMTKSIETLRQRERKLLTSHPRWKNLFSELDITIDLCIHRLTSRTVSPRTVTIAVSELQRAWRTAVAILDFVQIYEPRMMATDDLKDLYEAPESGERQRAVGSRLGAFVWNDKDAMLLFRAGVPVFFVRHYNDFDRQKILSVRSFSDPR
ncbi:hypothetical protein V5O48_018717 [Marasmius crinis-equi]|uniref:Uncharacterized protein n=1 Tax=Marasmius crinis-equi TaxID=585013 RepID=A0ABR3EKF0_9AGAR